MKYLKFISSSIKFIVKLGPLLFVVVEAFQMIQTKLEEMNVDQIDKTK